MTSKPGFSLVELLVVVTIIVLLIALLAPALDRAIYQAELAVCAAKLKALSTSVTTYAMEYRRHYPYRGNLMETDTGGNALGPLYKWRPNHLYRSTGYDLRRTLRGYVAINATMLDPMVKKVDLERNDTGIHIFASYPMWYGWHYTYQSQPLKGMFKIGDRFEWDGQSFDLLACDRDAPGTHGEISHPDKDGVAFQESWEDQDALSTGLPVGTLATESRWQVPTGLLPNPGRTLIDENFAYADGSLRRLTDIGWKEYLTGGRTSRVSYEEDERTWSTGETWVTVPRN